MNKSVKERVVLDCPHPRGCQIHGNVVEERRRLVDGNISLVDVTITKC